MIARMTKQLCTVASLVALSASAFAHPGHDHSHWLSPSVHAVLAISITGLVALSVAMYRKHKKSNQEVK